MSLTEQLKGLINQTLEPIHFELINESQMHRGHRHGSGHGDIGESHFNAVIVSEKFNGVSRVRRQQMIYALIEPFLESNGGTLHALSLTTLTPAEWQNKSQ